MGEEKPTAEPKQTTDKGLEIPIPKRKDVLDVFERAAKPKSDSDRGPVKK